MIANSRTWARRSLDGVMTEVRLAVEASKHRPAKHPHRFRIGAGSRSEADARATVLPHPEVTRYGPIGSDEGVDFGTDDQDATRRRSNVSVPFYRCAYDAKDSVTMSLVRSESPICPVGGVE